MNNTELPSDDLSRFALYIFRINGLLLRNGDRLTKPIGQSSARWYVLGMVGNEPQSVASAARTMGHARQSVQRIADSLVIDGLAKYSPDPKDKRAQILSLTPKGGTVLAEIYQRNQEWSAQLAAKIDSQQLAQLLQNLEMMQQVLLTEETIQ